MSSRCRIDWRVVAASVGTVFAAACNYGPPPSRPADQLDRAAVIDSALDPGVGHSLSVTDPRAARYYNNADAVTTGKRLFGQYNCSGCHSNGGGGMGPDLLDDVWIYGGRLEQIHQTLVQGRPNGMPAWGGKVPDEQLWQISAYVRSMSLPAPVPPNVDQDAGWSPPKDTTNDYTTTIRGPN